MSSDPLWAATMPTDQRDRPAPAPAATEELPITEAPRPAGPSPTRSGGRPRAGRRSGWRIGWRIAVTLLALGLGYFAVSLFQVWNTGRTSQAREVDAIVVLGAAQYDGRPSPQLRARLDEVVRLWPEGYAPLIVVTGGQQPGDRFTEAEASARYLVEQGIPDSALVFENVGRSTFESMEATASILAERGLDRVLLVTDPFHSLRSRLIAEEVGMEAYVAPTATSVVSGPQSAVLHVKEAGGVAIGRIIGFGRLSGLTG